jgi:HEAT repeat protein
MSGLALALVALLGCPKGGSTVETALPEPVSAREASDPVAVLTASATSEDPSPRARALALLLEREGPARWGTQALADESDWVRRAAIEALARRSDPDSRALLEALVANPQVDPYLRGLAALRAPGPASAEAIRAALEQEREAWRVAPLALAAVRLGDEGARPRLVRALETGELPLEIEFLHEIGQTGDPSLVPALVRAQELVEEELVLPIASARLMLGDAAGEQALRTALSEEDEERRLEALDYLVELEHPAATTLLRRASSLGPDLVTWYADLALAARTDTGGQIFEKAFADPDRELRSLAVRFAGEALGAASRRADKGAQKVLTQALSDPDAWVRAGACRAAAEVGMTDARPAMEALLADEVELVRVEASGALLELR